jgi:predicted nicotinamide N-methyase
MKAGARTVLAADIDAIALTAIGLNAAAHGVTIATTGADLLSSASVDADVILVGDLFYERALADRVLAFIEAGAALGALVLIGDPRRNYFPKGRFEAIAEYRVPVTRDLEDAEIKNTAVWGFSASNPARGADGTAAI